MEEATSGSDPEEFGVSDATDGDSQDDSGSEDEDMQTSDSEQELDPRTKVLVSPDRIAPRPTLVASRALKPHSATDFDSEVC